MSNPLERARIPKRSAISDPDLGYMNSEADRYHSDIAINLLQTCRAVYLETYTLPLSLNSYSIRDPSTHRVEMVSWPWQFALIQKLDICVQQVALEGDGLHNALLRPGKWCPLERHKGVYTAPRHFIFNNRNHVVNTPSSSFRFALVPAQQGTEQLRLSDALQSLAESPGEGFPWSSSMRVRLAKPLVQLTIRLGHMDWWTWADNPNSTDVEQQLGLDPAFGDGSSHASKRPTSARMRWLADERRAGRNPSLDNQAARHSSWAEVIGKFPDLKSLELVLETFAEKQHQLENVVECAKMWRFPIKDTQHELVWDGQVEASRWSMPTNNRRSLRHHAWYDACSNFEVRIIRYVRKRAVQCST